MLIADTSFEVLGWWADILLGKDVYYVFVFWLLETSQTSDRSQSKSNGGCLRGMLYILSMPLLTKGMLSCCTYRRGLSRRCSFRLYNIKA